MKLFVFAISIFHLLLFSHHLSALKSKPFKSEEDAESYLTTHYNLGCQYYNQEKWRGASEEFEKVIYFFPGTDAAAEAAYYLAVSYFERNEYDFANSMFSNYLKASEHPAFFEDAVYYKFCIAEHFRTGKKRRPFEARYLPKWMSAQDLALTIYDEIVAALPNRPLTIQALYSKAELLKQMGEYRTCIETYQTILRRFPKNEIVPTCYLNIADTYYQQSRYEFQNPDILALAELNVRKFRDDFPKEDRIALAEESVYRIKELYAKGLYNLGQFYERIEQPDAALIYYQSSIEEFPDTQIARLCRARLLCLGYEDENEENHYSNEEQSCLTNEQNPSDQLPEEPPFIKRIEGEESIMNEGESCISDLNIISEQMLAVRHVKKEQVEIEEHCPKEYVHYSLLKKKEVEHSSLLDMCGEESIETNEVVEGVIPSLTDNLSQEANSQHQEGHSRDLWHYSVIKERGNDVPSQE